MSEQTEQEMEVVERLEDIPAFATEEEEHRYWATHTLSKALYQTLLKEFVIERLYEEEKRAGLR